jgi:4-amino-4-deoxy-L-arabinose transferase-like glycosyltransferase
MQSISSRWYWLLLICLVAFFTTLYFKQALTVVLQYDSSDMVLQGRSMAQGHGFQFYDANNDLIGPYFNSTAYTIHAPGDPQPYNVFPPGLGLLVAAFYKLGGALSQVYLIAPLCGILGLIATAYLGYALNGRGASLLAVLLLGTSQLFVYYATSLWSDGPSVNLLLVGCALYWWAFQSKRWTYAILSGLVLGLFILLRYANFAFVLLILGHAVIFSRGRDRWTLIGGLLPGVLLGGGFLIVYQWVSFGGPLTNAYQAWGKSYWESGPLFSLSYLLVRTPRPWSTYTLNFIVETLWTDLRLWSLVALAGLMVYRRSSLKLLLAGMLLLTILIYGTSMFTSRFVPSARYMLPALAMAYLLAADALSRFLNGFQQPALRVGLGVAVMGLCLAGLAQQLPALQAEYSDKTEYINALQGVSRNLPADAVVLAYGASGPLILYGNISALNYRRLEATDNEDRFRKVTQAVQDLLSRDLPVYLIKDEESWFNLAYQALEKSFTVNPVPAPLPLYQITRTR